MQLEVEMVSVIMPTYNRRELISDAIDSVLNQSLNNLELIIIDDGSEDDTEAIIKSVSDERIRYFKLKHSGYIGRLRNYGISHSKGQLIAFIDSDDIWKKDKLAIQMSALKSFPEAGFCISDVTIFEGKDTVMPHVYKKASGTECINMFEQMKQDRFGIYPSTFLFKRACLEKTGLLHENIRSSDFNFNIRMAFHYKGVVVYEPLVMRRIHVTNRHNHFPVQNYHDYVTTFEFLHKEKMIGKKYLDKARSNASFKIGDLYLQKGEKNKARKHYFMALRYTPMFAQCYKRLLSSYVK